MIGIEKTKTILGKPEMTDQEAIAIRNTSYGLAELLIEILLSQQVKNSNPDLNHQQ